MMNLRFVALVAGIGCFFAAVFTQGRRRKHRATKCQEQLDRE